MATFTVTFHYLGCDWFLREKSWTEKVGDASRYLDQQAAGEALAKARRYMRNKQPRARIVEMISPAEARSAVRRTHRARRPVFETSTSVQPA